jgi:hypothetical protein
MGYIGRSIEYGSAVSQQITGTNSAGPYTLSYDTNTSGVVVSLDGVVQRNSVDFNIVGTALTFTSTVASGIIINVIFTGITLTFPTPSDNTVSLAKLTASGTASSSTFLRGDNTWASAGGPSLGTDGIIRTNAKTIAENITFAGTENGMTAGPVTINSGYTVTVTSGSTWTIV